MYLWEVTARTLGVDGAQGTHTFVVRAWNDQDAHAAALAIAHSEPAITHRRAARLRVEGLTVTQLSTVLM